MQIFKKMLARVLVCGLVYAAIVMCAQAAEPLQTTSIKALTTPLDVYKSESCSCCKEWVNYIDSKGFKAAVHQSADMNHIKNQYGIAPQYQSCHTAVSKQGYIFEGHVPAWLMSQFLASPPKGAKGLAVPGMPVGSAGMEMGDQFTPFDVLLLKNDGTSEVYAHIATIDEAKR